MAGKIKPGIAVKGINIKLKMINDLIDITGSAKDSWNPAEISDDMKAISYIHDLADTWNPAQLNEALKYLGFATIDSWNPAIIEETKNKLVRYFLPTEASGNPVTFNTYGNLPYEVSKAEVTFLPKQSGTGDPAPDNVRPITGYTDITLTVADAETSPTQTETYTETLGATYYGGKVDFVSGMATITHTIVDLGTLSWAYGNAGTENAYFYSNALSDFKYISETAINYICSNYKSISVSQRYQNGTVFINNAKQVAVKDDSYTDAQTFKTAMSGVLLCYDLDTPITLTLTETEIELLKGQNVVTTNSNGVITLVYKALLNS